MTRACFAAVSLMAAIGAFAATALAADIGQVKVVKGEVTIERAGAVLRAEVGTRVQNADVLKTGADGSCGLTMSDNSLLSMGPNSILTLDRFDFDSTTQAGRFETTLSKGSLAVISGRIAKQTPDAMKVRTPASVLGVRGTEFVVSVDE